jgi:hypothetical protein
MTTYAGAVPVTSVVCPAWCNVPQQEHLDDLHDNEGSCFHWSDRRGTGWLVGHQSMTFADGTPGNESDMIYPDAHAQSLPPTEAEAFARAVHEAVEEARTGIRDA